MNSVEKSLLKSIDSMVYGHFDTVETTLSFKTFTEPGFIKCPDGIEKMTEVLYDAIKACKHPTLNPSIDEIYEFKKEEGTGRDALKSFIENRGVFETEDIDNTKKFLEITVPFKFLFVNIDLIIKNKDLEIKNAVVQTPLFRKEIK